MSSPLASPNTPPIKPRHDKRIDDEYGHDAGNESFTFSESSAQRSPGLKPADGARAMGVLPNGDRFLVPETVSFATTLLTPRCWTSLPILVWMLGMLFTIVSPALHFMGHAPYWVYSWHFIFWRLGYNMWGVAFILHNQSNHKSFEKWYKKLIKGRPWIVDQLERSVALADGSTYRASDYPMEFNAWVCFRTIVNIILGMDFLAYAAMVVIHWKAPDLTCLADIVRYAIGTCLILFALWSKSDAHRVIGDYAWYWGDFFFLLDKTLVFDGIFQMFPHPMYTVGYSFMYGFVLMTNSYTVFYMSLTGHLMQLLFLAFVENPHIDKTYNAMSSLSPEEELRDTLLYDEDTGYLAKNELVVVKNFNPLRGSDALLLVLTLYCVVLGVFLDLPIAFHIGHYICWRLCLTIVLGGLLRKQSESNAFNQQFRSPREAFDNWKKIYNTTVWITNLTFAICAWNLFQWENEWIQSTNARWATITMGMILVLLNIYVSWCVHCAIGDFGYFYGDFFVDSIPQRLTYTGIYRYTNNPDSSLGLAAQYGVALVSGNPIMLPLAIFSHCCVKCFEHYVEKPHIDRKYGKEVRQSGGLQSETRAKLRKLVDEMKRQQNIYDAAMNRIKAIKNKLILAKERRSKKKSTKPKKE